MRKRWAIGGAALFSVTVLVTAVIAWRAMRPAEPPQSPATDSGHARHGRLSTQPKLADDQSAATRLGMFSDCLCV
jgi:hypothetical protein